jgi:hypothetical protein
VPAHVLGHRRLGVHGSGHQEPDVALFEHERLAVAPPGLGTGVGHDVEPERTGEEGGEGARVAHPPFEVVDAEQPRRGDGGAGRAVAVSLHVVGDGHRGATPLDSTMCRSSQRGPPQGVNVAVR